MPTQKEIRAAIRMLESEGYRVLKPDASAVSGYVKVQPKAPGRPVLECDCKAENPNAPHTRQCIQRRARRKMRSAGKA